MVDAVHAERAGGMYAAPMAGAMHHPQGVRRGPHISRRGRIYPARQSGYTVGSSRTARTAEGDGCRWWSMRFTPNGRAGCIPSLRQRGHGGIIPKRCGRRRPLCPRWGEGGRRGPRPTGETKDQRCGGIVGGHPMVRWRATCVSPLRIPNTSSQGRASVRDDLGAGANGRITGMPVHAVRTARSSERSP